MNLFYGLPACMHTLTEYSRAHPHHRRAFEDRGDIVITHAHGEFCEVFETKALTAIVAQCPQARKRRALIGFTRGPGRHAHQSAQMQPLELEMAE